MTTPETEKVFTDWFESGLQSPDALMRCPPWPIVADFIDKKGNPAISTLDALATAQAYTKAWQADKETIQLKTKPLWRLADVAICDGKFGLEAIKIRIDRAHRLPSGAYGWENMNAIPQVNDGAQMGSLTRPTATRTRWPLPLDALLFFAAEEWKSHD